MNAKQIILHSCREAHLDAVLRLATTTEEIADYEGETYAFFSRERLHAMSGSPDVLFLVATADRELAGFYIQLIQRAAGMAYIVDLVIAPEYRRWGIGERFIRAGLAFAEKEGCDEIWCIVYEQNEAAWNLFEKYGFRRGKKFYFVGKMLK